MLEANRRHNDDLPIHPFGADVFISPGDELLFAHAQPRASRGTLPSRSLWSLHQCHVASSATIVALTDEAVTPLPAAARSWGPSGACGRFARSRRRSGAAA